MPSEPYRRGEARPPNLLTSLLTGLVLFGILVCFEAVPHLTLPSGSVRGLVVAGLGFVSSIIARAMAGPIFAAWLRFRKR